MKKFLAGGVGIAATMLLFLGSGPASAVNEYNGMTYEKAAASLKSSGANPVIRTREGSFLPTEKCLVVGSGRMKTLDSSGRSSGNNWYLDLNCNDMTAASGHPGNSAATPEGKRGKRLRDQGIRLSENYADATAQGKTPSCEKYRDDCIAVCKAAGDCSAELLDYLGL